MDAFPAYFPLAGRKVVIAGTGEAAEAKARLFEGSPASIVRLTGRAALNPHAYIGAKLVFVASDQADFVDAAVRAARTAGALVNVPDHPELCDFVTPAVIDRGEVVAAVGTGGASPILATMLRSDIEARVPQGAGRVAALLRSFQEEVRLSFPQQHLRRAFLRAAVQGPAAEAAAAGDMEQAAALFREALAAGVPPAGRVAFVAGDGPADLLTLRAARALSAADVLVADAGVDAEVLALARRDAVRMSPGDPAGLAALTAEGRHVVRVVAGPADPVELAALTAAGARVEALPTAR
ncbi:MAG: NAD(P)-dependent oxidoreductase [Phenylobacterium sp.]